MKNEEIIFERIFNAPLEAVWRANTEPEIIREWWAGRFLCSKYQNRLKKRR